MIDTREEQSLRVLCLDAGAVGKFPIALLHVEIDKQVGVGPEGAAGIFDPARAGPSFLTQLNFF